jgi:hypothetical protein
MKIGEDQSAAILGSTGVRESKVSKIFARPLRHTTSARASLAPALRPKPEQLQALRLDPPCSSSRTAAPTNSPPRSGLAKKATWMDDSKFSRACRKTGLETTAGFRQILRAALARATKPPNP